MNHENNVSNFDAQQLNDAIHGDDTVIVDFWAEWCQPCHMLAPTIEALADEYDERGVTVAKVDIDANQDLARDYGITSIPTVLVFSGGEVRERIVGVNAKERYVEAINAA